MIGIDDSLVLKKEMDQNKFLDFEKKKTVT